MAIDVRFTLPLPEIPEDHRETALKEAHEAFVMCLLRQGDISAGRAAELLGVDRRRLGEIMWEYKISPFGETPEDLEKVIREIRSRPD